MKRRGTWTIAAIVLAATLTGCGGQADAEKTKAGDPKSPDPKTAAGQTELVPAVPGVGEKGRDLADGPVGTPIKALFRTQELIEFNLKVAPAMKLYRAMNGHYPKTEKEFMSEIVEANRVRLPQLPPGQKYVYDEKRAAEMTEYDAEDPPLRVKREAN